jgi:hypothetical protein
MLEHGGRLTYNIIVPAGEDVLKPGVSRVVRDDTLDELNELVKKVDADAKLTDHDHAQVDGGKV